MLRFAAVSGASPQAAWRLLAEPRQWHRWAPHILGAVGLGDPEVQPGRSGAVLIVPGIPVPVRISAKQDGSSWDWQTGPLVFRHTVAAHRGGCEVAIEVRAASALQTAVRFGYGPVIELAVRKLARTAEASGD